MARRLKLLSISLCTIVAIYLIFNLDLRQFAVPPTTSVELQSYRNPLHVFNTFRTDELFMMIIVCSAVPNFSKRKVIRETWGSVSHKEGSSGPVKVAFIVGQSADRKYDQEIADEVGTYKDIIVGDFIDTYQNLTTKSVALLKWAAENYPRVPYVLKTDDDMFIHVPNLLLAANWISPKTNVMFGLVFPHNPVQRTKSSKWYVPKHVYAPDFYSEYLCGASYVLSGDLVPKLYAASLETRLFLFEDFYVTGLLASKVNATRVNVKGFVLSNLPKTVCGFRDVVSVHGVNEENMQQVWNDSLTSSGNCSES